MKKETKEKIKNWAKSEAPWLAIAAAGTTGLVLVFKKYTDDSNEIYKEQMQQRTDDQNQSYVNYLREALNREFAHHHVES